MSQLASLLSRFIESGVDRLLFTPNEPPHVGEGDARRPIAGPPVRAAHLSEAVSELLSADDIAGLSSTRPRIVRHEHEGEELVLEIQKHPIGVSLGVRSPTAAAAAKPRAQAAPVQVIQPQTPAAQPRPAPAPAPVAREPMIPKLDTLDEPMRPLDLDTLKGAGGRLIPSAAAMPQVTPMAPSLTRDDIVQIARELIVREVPRGGAAGAAMTRDDIAAIARDVAAREAAEIAERIALETARTAPKLGGPGAGPAAAASPFASMPLGGRSGPARIDGLLREMIQRKASDLHITAGAAPVFRVDGEIHFGAQSVQGVLGSDDIEAMVTEIMTPKAREDFATLRDADYAYEIKGLARFRVNVFQDRNGVGSVMRQIPIEVLSAEKLGLPKACYDMCWLSKGLVLVTGPTGSGKSTTLAAMIDFINKNRSDHIITIEDPVEFVHQNHKCLVNQREVGLHTKSFKNALRAALREDPDIVLVGEMRDLETISIAIETAETGHLVFGTLHTTTAVSTVDRIIDQFPSDRQAQIRVMLSESLKGVVAQNLVPKIGGGRVAAQEILLGTHAVAAMIRDGKTFQLPSVMQTSKQQGMVTMNDALMALVQKKLVDPKDAFIKAVDKTGFAGMLKAAGIAAPV
ncbi:MAG: type IV pilus twitching motility protein PilT [Labilithrix sp.]